MDPERTAKDYIRICFSARPLLHCPSKSGAAGYLTALGRRFSCQLTDPLLRRRIALSIEEGFADDYPRCCCRRPGAD